ncbi:Insect cuticle protein, partial [Oryctes borbonicus]
PDSYHESHANRNNVVNGAFGGRNPATGSVDRTEYTAGPRGFRPKGKNVVRKYDPSQRPTGPIGSKDDPYFDPYEDPSYNFQFNTRVYNRKEGADRNGDVKGSYTYLDDVGDKHEVEYIAGRNTGFHVKTPYPDSYPNSYRTLYFRDPRKPYMRGRSFIQRGIDGSYRFAALGPDHRRTEISDSIGNVRGSYTYKDEKGVTHSVHYIAGPNIGYRVLKNVKGPHLPTIFPFNSQDIVPSDFYDAKESDSDVFAQAASTYVTPKPNKDQDRFDSDSEDSNQIDKGTVRPTLDSSTFRPTKPPQSAFGRPTRPSQSTYDGQTKPPQGAYGGPIRPPQNIFEESGNDDDEEQLFMDLFKPVQGRPSTIKPSTYRPPIRPRPPQTSVTTIRPQDLGGKPGITDGGGSQVGKPGFGITSDNNIFGTRPPVSQESKPDFGITGGGSIFDTRPPTSPGIFSMAPSGTSDEDFLDIGASSSGSEDGIFGPTPSPPYGSRPPFTGGPFARPRPPRPTRPTKPILQFDLTAPDDGDRYHTIITNYGDTVFTAPPGVPVRAHVQSIGLVPLFPRSPSPSEQYNTDIEGSTEERDIEAAANSHINVSSTSSTVTTTILAAPSMAPSSTLPSVETTASVDITTTQLPETTTTS